VKGSIDLPREPTSQSHPIDLLWTSEAVGKRYNVRWQGAILSHAMSHAIGIISWRPYRHTISTVHRPADG